MKVLVNSSPIGRVQLIKTSTCRTIALIDVAGGTGDIAFGVLETIRANSGGSSFGGASDTPSHHVTVCDINASMLGVVSSSCTPIVPANCPNGEAQAKPNCV